MSVTFLVHMTLTLQSEATLNNTYINRKVLYCCDNAKIIPISLPIKCSVIHTIRCCFFCQTPIKSTRIKTNQVSWRQPTQEHKPQYCHRSPCVEPIKLFVTHLFCLFRHKTEQSRFPPQMYVNLKSVTIKETAGEEQNLQILKLLP